MLFSLEIIIVERGFSFGMKKYFSESQLKPERLQCPTSYTVSTTEILDMLCSDKRWLCSVDALKNRINTVTAMASAVMANKIKVSMGIKQIDSTR